MSRGAVILGYHDVVADDADRRTRLCVTAADLDRHLQRLRARGSTIVGLDEIVARQRAGRSIDRLAAVTFDDALRGVHDHGLEVLRSNDVTATLFVVTGSIGVEQEFWPEAGATMTRCEVAACVAAGVSIGSHTVSHPSLPRLSDEELESELHDSRFEVERFGGIRPDLLAYPSGHHNRRVRTAAARAGYRGAVTFLNGRFTAGNDTMRIPRFTMGSHSSAWRFAYQLRRPARSWPDHQLEAVGAAP